MSSVPYLDSLSAATRTALLATGRERVYPKGGALFYEGDDAHDVLLILGGTIKVSISNSDGREVILDVLGPGEIVGELSAIDASPRSATGMALTDVTACVIRQRDFVAQIASRPDAATALLLVISQRLRGASRRQFEFGAGDALGRLCRSLCDLDQRYGTGADEADGANSVRVFTMPFGQQELAAHAGLSREAVVKALSSLRTLGWISMTRRVVQLHDADAVRDRATGAY